MHLIQECREREHLREQYQADPPDWYESGHEVHTSQNAYLLRGDETLLFDTLSPVASEQIVTELREVLDDDNLDYIVISHPEAPHAGNTFGILEEFPDAELIAPAYGNQHELYHLEDATKVALGDCIDLGEFEVEFVEPMFVDHKLHTWMRELKTDTLFTVDWLGMIHKSGECLDYVDEMSDPVTVDRLTGFHGRALFWLAYVDPHKTDDAIEGIIEEWDPNVLAPAHGQPVRQNTAAYMRRMKDVTRKIAGEGRLNGAW